MPDIDFSEPFYFLLATAVLFIVVVFRYFLIAGLFHIVFYLYPSRWKNRKISAKNHNTSQLRKEISWSIITSLIFAVVGALVVVAWQNGWTRIYIEIQPIGWLWFLGSLMVYMIIHETYYYWVHRWMHHPKIFRHIHKVHHDSKITSPWTAFSFHPIEGFIEAIILPMMLFLIPINYYALIIYLTIMTFSSVVNHLDIEVYPKEFNKHWLGRWLIGASHHSLHHSQFKFNYGLYFTFWDKLTDTESPEYEKLFKNKTDARPS
ncbi:MAG TPA: sterol desaturase family protein [Cytophagaceae bacterium]|jgi:sterol desaturase/sphingolipid hydroxylase (fatty acid hydroxylase superfamily)